MKKAIDLVVIFILSLGYYTYSNKIFSINYYLTILIGYIFVVFYFGARFFFEKHKLGCDSIKKNIIAFFTMFIIFLIGGYGVILVNPNFINVQKYMGVVLLYTSVTITGFSIFGLYKEKAIEILFCAAVANYSIYIVNYVINQGIGDFFKVFYYIIKDNNDKLILLEAHEVTFVIGLCFCYFVSNDVRKNFYKILISVICILIGYKRILIGAIIVSFILLFLIKKIAKNNIKCISAISTIGCIGVSLLWVYLVSSQTISSIASDLNINLMGRDRIYSYYDGEYYLGLLYMGKGLGYISTFNQINNINISMHSDILKLYIELGFVGYLLLMIILGLFLPIAIEKNSGNKCALTYFVLLFVTMICCFTDNLASYYNYLLVLIVLFFSLYYHKKNRMKELYV